MRPERPLTRRELRELERATEVAQGEVGAAAAMLEPAPAVVETSTPVVPAQAPPVTAPLGRRASRAAEAAAAVAAESGGTPMPGPVSVVPSGPAAAPVAPAAAPAPAFDSLFGDLLISSDEDAPSGTSTRPIVLPEASVLSDVNPIDELTAPIATRRSRDAAAAAKPAKPSRSAKREARRRGPEVPTAPRGRDGSTRPRSAAFTAPTATTGAAKAGAGSAAKAAPLRRRAARMTTLVAMSFAALLAVATSVPSLSLLSAADVQAMALSGSDSGREPGQTLDTSGDAIASPNVDLESYKSQSIAEYAAAAGIRAEATFTNNPNGTIQWPFAVGVHIGDRFGYRDCAGCSSDHHGQDFNPGYGAEIQAIADGVVSQSTDSGGSLGTVMMIDHVIDGEVVTSVYAHMISGSRLFEVGDTVKVGDVIGKTGNTGMSTGPHLHFEIRLGGVNGTWTDPLEWLYANTN